MAFCGATQGAVALLIMNDLRPVFSTSSLFVISLPLAPEARHEARQLGADGMSNRQLGADGMSNRASCDAAAPEMASRDMEIVRRLSTGCRHMGHL